MYTDHFGLNAPIVSDTIAREDQIFRGPGQIEVETELTLALGRGDAVAVVYGAAGTGKSTLAADALRESVTQLAIGSLTDLAQTPHELLEHLLIEFGFSPYKMSRSERLGKWRQYLAEMSATGTRVGIVVENADRLSVEVLAELEALTGRDIRGAAGANLLLTARAPIAGLDSDPRLTPLRQRCRAVVEVPPLTAAETADYLQFRLALVGADWTTIATPGLDVRIHAAAAGTVRMIDNIVEGCLARTALAGGHAVTPEILDRVVSRLPGAASGTAASVVETQTNGLPAEPATSVAGPAEPVQAAGAPTPTPADVGPPRPAELESPKGESAAETIETGPDEPTAPGPLESAELGAVPEPAAVAAEPTAARPATVAAEPTVASSAPVAAEPIAASPAPVAAEPIAASPAPVAAEAIAASPAPVAAGLIAEPARADVVSLMSEAAPLANGREHAEPIPIEVPAPVTVGRSGDSSDADAVPPDLAAIPVLEDAVEIEFEDTSVELDGELPIDGDVIDALLALPGDESPADGENGSAAVAGSAPIDELADALPAALDLSDDLEDEATALSDEDRQQIEMLEAFANAEALEEISESMAETIFGDLAADDISLSISETFDRLSRSEDAPAEAAEDADQDSSENRGAVGG